MQHFVIKNATLCDHQGVREADVLICNGIIEKIGQSLDAPKVVDGTSLHLLPALIDLNAKPKSFQSKDLKRFIQKAKNGGVSTLGLVPQQDPYQYDFLKSFSFVLGITPFADSKLQNVSILHKAGGRFLHFPSNLSNHTLKSIYDYAKMLQIPCVCYAQDEELSHLPSLQSQTSYHLGLGSYPSYLQSLEFAKITQLAEIFQIPTLLQSIHQPKVLQSKTNFVLNEVSIHHLIANESQIQGFNTLAKLHPPLCTLQDQQEMQNQLQNIDMLTSLHQECSTQQKEQTFDEAQSGIECLECYFPLLYTTLVKTNLLSLASLSKLTAFHQSQFLKLPQGEIQEGLASELILVDLNASIPAKYPLSHLQEFYGKIKAFISSQEGYQEI